MLVSALDVAGSRKRARLDVLKGWMTEAKMPPSLHRRLLQRRLRAPIVDRGKVHTTKK